MQVSRFSPNGDFLAVCGADGHLRIWETATSKLWQEFIPSSHLSANCTCLDWAPMYQDVIQKGKKKKKKRIVEGDIIALGTTVGSLLFYDVSKSQVASQPNSKKSGTGSVINGVTWSSFTLSVYSCGDDGVVREWDPENSSITSQWTVGKGSLTAIQSINTHLLIAGQSVHLWDLKSKTTIATFTGHPGQIDQLEVIPTTDYFLSMSHGDRNLQIWQIAQTNSVATLAIPEPPINCHVSTSGNGTASIAVTTKKGALHVFQHKLNGHTKKPLVPASTVTIVDSSDDSKVGVPILSGFLSGVSTVTVLAAYGNWLKLRFEKLEVSSLQSETILSREFSHQTIIKSKSKSKRKGTGENSVLIEEDHVEVPNDVKHLQPGTEALNKVPTTKGKKRKQDHGEKIITQDEEGRGEEKVEDGELPMEERLTNLTIDAPARSDVPQGENLAHLLSQGLHSKDTRILNSVLCRWDEKVIMNTVRSLPVQLVIPLLEEIKVMLTGKAVINHNVLKWLGAVFQIHSSYLMSSFPSSEDQMGPIMSLLRARETLYPQMCLLKGKLELIKGHVAAKQYKADVPNTALLTYQDESSEDEDANDDTLLPSESEDFLTSDDLGVDDDENSESDSGESNKDNDDEDKDIEDETSSDEEGNDGGGVKLNGRQESDESMEEED